MDKTTAIKNPQPNYFVAWWGKEETKNLPSLEQGSTVDRNVPETGTLHHLTIICGHSRMRNGPLSEGRQ